MALPPESVCRGVAAAIPQPATPSHIQRLQEFISALTFFNAQGPRILYRDPTNDQDIIEAVYRWDDRPYTEILATGFRPRDQRSTSNEDYFNLERHVNSGGAPADTSPAQGSAFVSTTRSTSYRPILTTETILYRYEIFAPGGIDATLTLREHNDFPNQQEISFIGGIRPQYIRSVRTYSVVTDGEGGRFPYYTSEGYRVYRNANFNPNPNMDGYTPDAFLRRLRNIRCPRDGQEMVNVVLAGIQKRSADYDNYYASCNSERYVDCAFNYNVDDHSKAFIFTADQCFLISYTRGKTDDTIEKGPMSIGKFFPILEKTIFATGIDAAFTAKAQNVAYIFKNNMYTRLNFVDKSIIGEIKQITDGLSYLENSIFKDGIDAAFASDRDCEAYIFKGDRYALINFAKDCIIGGPKKIIDGFGSFKNENKMFADGIDAAFSIKGRNEAYIFKGNTYALINYAPGTKNDEVLWKVTPISQGFRSLEGFIPSYISQLDNICTKAEDDYHVDTVTEEPFVDSNCKEERFVECAFNFNNDKDEAFLFTADQCVHINYAPGTTEDYIIKGPMSIAEFFPFLENTIFASGIDAAFTSKATNEAYIFRSNICAHINFETGHIIGAGGPKLISEGFHFLKNTIFEHGIDAAFASDKDCEAYIFRGNQYALIDFTDGKDGIIGGPKKITDGFGSFKDDNKSFADGIDAAFSIKGIEEAYIFKGNTYARIKYAPGTKNDEIRWKVTPISDGFCSLKNFIPWRACNC